MKHLLLSALLLVGLASCTKKAYPTSASQLIQGTWRLKATEGTDTPPAGTTTPVVTHFKPGDVVVVWTATTVEEYVAGDPQSAATYTIAGNTITTKSVQGGASTGQILTLTKNKLRISRPQHTTLTGGPGSSAVVCTYVK